MSHKKSSLRQAQIAHKREIDQLRLINGINNMQDEPNSHIPGLIRLHNHNHWYNRAARYLHDLPITKKILFSGIIFLIILDCGGEYYENTHPLSKPETKKEIIADKRAYLRRRRQKAKKVHHSYQMAVKLNPSQVNRIRNLSKRSKYRAWRLKTLLIYRTRMRTCRSIISRFEQKESYYNKRAKHYEYIIRFDSAGLNDNIMDKYKNIVSNANSERKYYHRRANFYWRYRHKIRAIEHRALHINIKPHHRKQNKQQPQLQRSQQSVRNNGNRTTTNSRKRSNNMPKQILGQ